VLDARIPDGLSDIRSGWTLDDLLHGHDLLDELDAVEVSAASAAGSAVKGRRP
jgi:hypothetical protein